MSNMLRTMARGSMAPHHWHGWPWRRRVEPRKAKKSGTMLDFLRGGLSSGTAPVYNGRGASKPTTPGFLQRMVSKVAGILKSQRGR